MEEELIKKSKEAVKFLKKKIHASAKDCLKVQCRSDLERANDQNVTARRNSDFSAKVQEFPNEKTKEGMKLV